GTGSGSGVPPLQGIEPRRFGLPADVLTAWWAAAAVAGDGGYGESWIAVPAAFYSQETSVGAVVFGSGTFRVAGPDTWPPPPAAALVGTVRGQATFTVWPTLFFGPDDRWTWTGRYIVAHFPTRYYGLGPETTGVYQTFTRRWLLTETSVLRKVHGPLYA